MWQSSRFWDRPGLRTEQFVSSILLNRGITAMSRISRESELQTSFHKLAAVSSPRKLDSGNQDSLGPSSTSCCHQRNKKKHTTLLRAIRSTALPHGAHVLQRCCPNLQCNRSGTDGPILRYATGQSNTDLPDQRWALPAGKTQSQLN